MAAEIRQSDRFSAAAIVGFLFSYLQDVFTSLRLAARRWQMDDAASMSAAVAYYLALSVFPMLLILSSGIGLFLKFTHLGKDAELQILNVVSEHCSPSLEAQIQMMLSQFKDQSLIGGPFGLGASILTAIGVFYQFERAFDKIWRIPPRTARGALHSVIQLIAGRLMAFLMLGCVGLVIVAIGVANIAIGALREWMTHLQLPGTVAITLVDASATLFLNTLAFAFLYRYLPKRKVRWRDAFRSSLLVAIIWEISRGFLLTLLIGTRYTTTYGAIGSFIAVLLWFYWGVTILFFGAEYLQVLSRRNNQPFKMFAAAARGSDELSGGPLRTTVPRRAA